MTSETSSPQRVVPSPTATATAASACIELSNESDLYHLLASLPSHGTISYEKSTNYWSLSLPTEWQTSKAFFANWCQAHYRGCAWYAQAIGVCQQWAKSVNAVNPEMKFVPPPSLAGLHITLGVWSADDIEKPPTLEVGKQVNFRLKKLISFRSIRMQPQNIPGQETDADGFRFYPTQWIFVTVEFVGFEIETRYQPHISLCCVAVHLAVVAVDRVLFVSETNGNSSDSSSSSSARARNSKSQSDRNHNHNHDHNHTHMDANANASASASQAHSHSHSPPHSSGQTHNKNNNSKCEQEPVQDEFKSALQRCALFLSNMVIGVLFFVRLRKPKKSDERIRIRDICLRWQTYVVIAFCCAASAAFAYAQIYTPCIVTCLAIGCVLLMVGYGN